MLNANDCRIMAALLDEAARNLRAVMETDIAEREQFRHFLPDELEGSAIMLREQADALGVMAADEVRRLAEVALRESAGDPPVTGWQSAALKVCRAVLAEWRGGGGSWPLT